MVPGSTNEVLPNRKLTQSTLRREIGHMTQPAPNRSARIMGQDFGLTATEMNFLLKEAGLLEGGPGAWAVTEKGKQYADEQDHHRGTGGYSWYNPVWETRTWDPSITDELDITNERRQQAREAARYARQQKADLRAVQAGVQAAALDSAGIDDAGPNGSGPGPLALVGGVVLVAVSIYGLTMLARRLRTLRTDKAAPQAREVEEPDRRRHKTQAETPDSDEDSST